MKKKRPTIGFLTDWVESSYHLPILAGINEKAIELDVNILTFVGGAINSPHNYEKLRNIIYQFATSRTIDGLIISTGSIGHYITDVQLTEFINSYQPIPVVSLSQEIGSVHSILVDNKPGLHEMILHLIKKHGYSKPAFVSGPENNQESILRLNTYKEALSECNIPFKQEFVVPGKFIAQSGKDAVRILLDERRVKPDVIIAANDGMAMGLLEELQDRNISIPYEIAITGFDDQLPCQFTNPTISTIKQPIREQGSKALEIVLAILSGKTVPKVTTLPTKAIFRESCGCYISMEEYHSISLKKNESKIEDISSISIKNSCPEEMLKQIEAITPMGNKVELNKIIRTLFRNFIKSIEDKNGNTVIKILKSFLYSKKNTGIEERIWQHCISLFRFYLNPDQKDKEKKKFYEELLDIIKLIITEYYTRLNSNLFIERESVTDIYRDTSEALTAMNSMEEIAGLLERRLPEIGISSCYFSLYEGNGKYHPSSSLSRLVLAFNRQGSIILNEDEVTFPTEQLVPNNILGSIDRFSLYIDPLFSGTQQLGIALYDIDRETGLTFDIMRRILLNSALKGAIYTQKLKKQAAHMEETNKQLRKTLKTLKKTQDKLVESEKMAALGGLVAGVAHEINTPLGISVTAASHLQKLTEEIAHHYASDSMKKSHFEHFILDAGKATSMLLVNLERAYKLINSFKKIAVNQSLEKRKQFALRKHIEEILLSLNTRLKETNHHIILECDKDLEIDSYPGCFTQIISNLLINSLIHGYSTGTRGTITIKIHTRDNVIMFRYSDDGIGIEKKNLKKIFEPFFTSNRAKAGTGLGLHLVYNIVTHTLGGTIRCMSSKGNGTTFVITIPILSQDDSAHHAQSK
ncbi:MAG: substrate-binding domain-containing protein [Spirochaetales bacterium]|nr:substrate-binding domain-containing protein [Spirochaetales bacterium]